MRVLVLAAGYGTRLYPLTRYIPKALICAGGKPIINFIMEKIEKLKRTVKIKEVVIISNNRFYRRFLDWKRNNKFAVKILNDGSNSPDDRLGAIGDIDFVITNSTADDWFILGSDNFFDWELEDFLRFSLNKKPYCSLGVYELGNKSAARNFGVVNMNRLKRINSFVEKPTRPKSTKVATCIYFFPRQSLYCLRRFLEESRNGDVSGRYIEWLVQESCVYGYEFKGKWLDIGCKSTLKILEKLVRCSYVSS